MKKFLILTICAGVLAFGVGCSSATVAEYVGVIASEVNVVLSLVPGWSGSATVKSLLATVQADAANWQSGTKSQDFSQAVTDLASAVDTIPANSKVDEAVAVIVAALDGLAPLITAENQAPTTGEQYAAFMGWLDSSQAPPARQHVYTGKPIKSAKDLKAALSKAQAPAKSPNMFKRAWQKIK